MTVRKAVADDRIRIGQIAEASGLFPANMAPDMMAPALGGNDDVWMVAEHENRTAGFSFARREEMTDRTWNILALGLEPEAQGHGHGRALLRATEETLPNARMVIIETTQLPDQDVARGLYASAGYTQHSQIPDFFGDGEDKVIFSKRMADAS